MVNSMRLHELKPPRGSRHRRKIVGRGEGSGHGGSATRGTKGQGARSGDGRMVGFEGGQMPLSRRIPKRGFSRTRLRIEYGVVNISDIAEMFDQEETVLPAMLVEKGLVRKNMPVKILGDGSLTKKLTVHAHAFSASAEDKIKKAGGTIEKITRPAGKGNDARIGNGEGNVTKSSGKTRT